MESNDALQSVTVALCDTIYIQTHVHQKPSKVMFNERDFPICMKVTKYAPYC